LELKAEGYEFEGQSYLFWEYMRLLNECKPTYFLLENVEMGEKWEKVLSKAIGVNGIHINSALVSAQNRKRIYWTNIGMQPSGLFGDLESVIQQPKDRCILLKDILESDVDEKYFLSEKMIEGFERHKERHNDKGTGFGYIPKNETDKGNSLRANAALCPTDNMIIVQDAHNISNQGKVINEKLQKSHSLMARDYKGFGNQGMTGIIVHSTFGRTSTNGNGGNGHLSKDGDKSYCLDAANSMAVELREVKQLNPSTESGGTQPYQQNRVYDVDKISPALNTDGRSHAVEVVLTSKDKRLKQTIDKNDLKDGEIKALDVYNQSIHNRYPTLKDPKHNDRALFDGSRIRRLTPIECERLQTVADNYTTHVSDSQRYKMLGNGWTIDVIAHIFSYLPKEIINNI
jgi:DNA (cytosine-5)-methyltransferase 3A